MITKLLSILTIVSCLCVFNPVNAEEDETYDISKWAFIMLTKKSDQDKSVYVSKYYNVEDSKLYAFCIEPKQRFLPATGIYTQMKNDNDFIYKVVKAYDEIGLEDDNYYIAAQLLIWEEIDGVTYTFNGEDYSEYKNDILNIIYPKKIMLVTSNENNDNDETISSYVGEEIKIENDYSEYSIEGEGIKIISNDENGLVCVIDNEEPIIKKLDFTPIINDEDKSYKLISETSQDLYFHDGEYKNLNPFSISLMTLSKPKFFTINYSKLDEQNNPIKGAEFSLYQINNETEDQEIIFIKNDEDIDICKALLGDTNNENLIINVSERYKEYINGNIIHTKEIGYFPYEIYQDEILIKQGKVYVTNDDVLSNNSYSKSSVSLIFSGYSENLSVNSINDVLTEYSYYLCESEPKRGYTYASEPCVLVNPHEYNGEVYEFINNSRTYTLRLMKQSPEQILLNGARFKITYYLEEELESIEFVTGALFIERENNAKYLIYKHETEDVINIYEFNNSHFELDNAKEGKYYYYQSDSTIVNDSLLYENEINVIKGGFNINNLPYSSSLTVEELQAPKGYIITEPVYYISPDIPYSDITFKNYRVNTIDIIPNKFIIPKTCIN